MLRFGLTLSMIVVLLDHTTKWWARAELLPSPRTIHVADFFNIVLGFNKGVSFGLLGDVALPPFILAGFSLAIAAIFLLALHRTSSRVSGAGYGLLIGGAVANAFDRLINGAVTDFLDFHLSAWHWPTFNFADVAICTGVALLIVDSFRDASTGTAVN